MNSVIKSNSTRNNRALTAEWSTPQDLFNKLNDEFHFTLDACAQPFNAKSMALNSRAVLPPDTALKSAAIP